MVWTPQGFKTPHETDTAPHTDSKTTKKATSWIWPTITDLESAKRAALQGSWAAVIVGVERTFFTVFGHRFVMPDFITEGLFIAVGYAIIAFAIYRMSRTAAITGLGSILLGPIRLWDLLIFTPMLINSVRGTFKYHKIANSRVIVRNAIILNVLALLYSSIALAILMVVLPITLETETVNETILGAVMLLLAFIVYCLTLMRLMPFTKNRVMVDMGGQGVPD